VSWSAEERPLPEAAAVRIRGGFLDHGAEFRRLTLQARARFEQRDWIGGRRDAVARLGLYRSAVGAVVDAVQAWLGPRAHDRSLWRAIRADYARLVAERHDAEIARTFFNSVTRHVFSTVGVDPEVEFGGREFGTGEMLGMASARSLPDEMTSLATPATPMQETRASTAFDSVVQTFVRQRSIQDLVREILQRYRFGVGYEDLERDAQLVAREIESYAPRVGVRAIEVAQPVFYRNKAAYLVGRVRSYEGNLPLVLALLNPEGRVRVDAVLLAEHEVSVVFSYTRSHFLVATERPGTLVRFLRALMPHKPVDELFTAIGYSKHGKTELFRALRRHLESSDDQFELARGARGMVMIVFTMPSYDIVFKIIRDRFLPPKTTTRRQVMEKYHLVFQHDRAGRLVDAQEFEHLAFGRSRFTPELLRELQEQARDTVEVEDDRVVIHHLYTERRVTPLDLYLREARAADAVEAVLDYGEALRELAANNIFPGDLLLKNFGVTRNRRVVFYDYDELCLLTDCNFRHLPPASDEEEWAGEPWFYAGDNDVFPEEFGHFLEIRGALRDAFTAVHGDLLTVSFWDSMQAAQREGQILDLFPYPRERRLHG